MGSTLEQKLAEIGLHVGPLKKITETVLAQTYLEILGNLTLFIAKSLK